MSNKESLTYHNYTIKQERKSQYVDGLTISDGYRMRCPACGKVRADIDHGETVKCMGCGLSMQVYGNNLTIWRDGFLSKILSSRAGEVK